LECGTTRAAGRAALQTDRAGVTVVCRGTRGKVKLPDGREDSTMQTVKFVYWEEDDAWIGHLQDYPDYWTQGETLDDLKEHLKDLHRDLTCGNLPGIRKVDDLIVYVV
jgi:hypothetical protein